MIVKAEFTNMILKSIISISVLYSSWYYTHEDERAYKRISIILARLIALLVILGGLTLEWHIWFGVGFAIPEFAESAIIAAWIVGISWVDSLTV